MKTMFKSMSLCSIALSMLALTSCQEETFDAVQPPIQEQVPKNILAGLEDLGFDVQTIPVTKEGEFYKVEGDILMYPEDILNPVIAEDLPADTGIDTKAAQRHRRFNIVTPCDKARFVRVKSNFAPNSIAGRAIAKAIKAWNQVSDNVLFFKLVNTRPDVTIRFAGTGGSALSPGRRVQVGEFLNLNPFRLMQVRPARNPNASNVDFIAKLVAHELGHTVGFSHRNSKVLDSDIFINNTRFGADKFSVMNGDFSQTERILPILSSTDRVAVKQMFGIRCR
ncbi:M57 family metalloprotease [Aquimarina sp. ERC-38]|uniref:M57 family metalloprotease n=1 Tax=Aquimarina sp. ERC-38 TaxID=2949996 RepID=UPI0022480C22|nr:M57 family metalloprotease [Aquimarina sp. ERC-38]UZO80142.1 M57 family metalloprotease [Aquimarina sp. ERC-38]